MVRSGEIVMRTKESPVSGQDRRITWYEYDGGRFERVKEVETFGEDGWTWRVVGTELLDEFVFDAATE